MVKKILNQYHHNKSNKLSIINWLKLDTYIEEIDIEVNIDFAMEFEKILPEEYILNQNCCEVVVVCT